MPFQYGGLIKTVCQKLGTLRLTVYDPLAGNVAITVVCDTGNPLQNTHKNDNYHQKWILHISHCDGHQHQMDAATDASSIYASQI